MIYPTLASLLEKVDSKYTLVVAVSKRARQLVDGQPKLTKVIASR
jgi:DNA-directed RNA polymerase subunit omega